MIDIVEEVRKRIEIETRNPTGIAARRPSPPATYASIAADERSLGFAFPPLLKRLYTEVGNGGWGPGYGLLGLTDGATDDLGHTAVQSYLSRNKLDPSEPSWRWPEGLLPICHWGCAIYSCIDCLQPSFPLVCFDPNLHNDDDDWVDARVPEDVGFDVWIELWVGGHDLWNRLYGEDGIIMKSAQARPSASD